MIALRVSVWAQHRPKFIEQYRPWLDATDDRDGRERRWLQLQKVQQRDIRKISFIQDHPFRTSFVTHFCLFPFTHIAPHQRCSINHSVKISHPRLLSRLPNPIIRRAACKCPQSLKHFQPTFIGTTKLAVFFRSSLHYPCHFSLLVRLQRCLVCHWSC